MKNAYLIIFVAFAVVLMQGTSIGQGTTVGPRIVLEEEEITLMEDGKEVKRVYVSKKEKETIIKEVKEKVLRKLGVTSEGEAIEQKLGHKFDEETKKLISAKALNQPKLNFVDTNGNVVKEIDVRTGIQREVSRSHPKLKKPHLMEEYISRYVVLSQDGKFAVLSESLSEGIVPETEQEKKSMMDTDAGYMGTSTVVKYYDARGNILWERQTPSDMRVNQAMISNNGNVIAYMQDFKGIGDLQESEPPTKLFVVDKEGKEIFAFPAASGEYSHWEGSKIVMSPSGGYLSVVGWKGVSHVNFFFNIKNKTAWVSDAYYDVWSIGDDGQAEVSYVDVKKPGRKTINLKLYLGE